MTAACACVSTDRVAGGRTSAASPRTDALGLGTAGACAAIGAYGERMPRRVRRRAEANGDRRAADAAAVTRSASFEEVFDRHYERLVRSLTVVAGNRDDAADAVQDAFVKAHLRWRSVGRYDDPVGWVRHVAVNRLRDQHRRTARKRRAADRLAAEAAAHSETPDIDEFDRLLAALPRQQRIATALFYVERLTIAEIAATLDLSDGTVKSHLHAARARLRPILEDEGEHV